MLYRQAKALRSIPKGAAIKRTTTSLEYSAKGMTKIIMTYDIIDIGYHRIEIIHHFSDNMTCIYNYTCMFVNFVGAFTQRKMHTIVLSWNRDATKRENRTVVVCKQLALLACCWSTLSCQRYVYVMSTLCARYVHVMCTSCVRQTPLCLRRCWASTTCILV